MSLINIKNLSKKFGDEYVLKNINFTVDKGDALYIVGENGSGKTTLVKILLGIIPSSSGEIIFEEKGKNSVGYLPQLPTIQSDFPASVFEVVLSGTLGKKTFFYTKEQKQTALKNMERLGVAELKNKSFRFLSGGQKQRVLLARALGSKKDILLLDEPITALDPLATAQFYELLEDLRKIGITLIIISHDVECAVKYGNKILHLGGNETFFGTNEEYIHSEIGKRILKGGHTHD